MLALAPHGSERVAGCDVASRYCWRASKQGANVRQAPICEIVQRVKRVGRFTRRANPLLVLGGVVRNHTPTMAACSGARSTKLARWRRLVLAIAQSDPCAACSAAGANGQASRRESCIHQGRSTAYTRRSEPSFAISVVFSHGSAAVRATRLHLMPRRMSWDRAVGESRTPVGQ